MKPKYLACALFVVLLSLSLYSFKWDTMRNSNTEVVVQKDSVLRHVVLFKFKQDTSPEKVKEIVNAFSALPSKIKEIADYEWGLNNSPEGLNKGLTHGFLLTFKSEADRDSYLPHPDHKAFGALLTPYLEDVTVFDYWTHKSK